MRVANKIIYLKQIFRLRVYARSGIPKVLDGWRAKNRRDAVFIWIPKNAGTSLHSSLNCPRLLFPEEAKWRFCGRGLVTFGHMDYRALVEKGWVSKQFDHNAYKFAFARNPFSRAVSLYFYQRGKRFPAEWSFADLCRRIEADEIEPIGLYNSIGISQSNPQYKWLENIKLDFLGRFESVDSDLERIRKTLGLEKVAIPRLNKSTNLDYRELYDERSRKAVTDYYRRDFEELGYSTDLNLTGVDSIVKKT